MTLPQATSRPIDIDGVPCRWMTTRRAGILHVTVQSGTGPLLRAYLEPHALFRRGSDAAWSYSRQTRRVGPGLVRRLFAHAVANGWRPVGPPTPPFEIATWSGEKVAGDAGAPAQRAGEIPLRDLALAAVSDLRFDLSTDPAWRRRLFAAKVQERFDIPGDFLAQRLEARRHGLRFRAFNDGWTTGGSVVFGIESVEVPTVVMYTTNWPGWPPD